MKYLLLSLFLITIYATTSEGKVDAISEISKAIDNNDFSHLNITKYAFYDIKSFLNKTGKITIIEDGSIDKYIHGYCRITQDPRNSIIRIEYIGGAENKRIYNMSVLNEFLIGSSNKIRGMGVSQRILENNLVIYKNDFDKLSLKTSCGPYGYFRFKADHIYNTLKVSGNEISIQSTFTCDDGMGISPVRHFKLTRCQF